MPAISPTTSSIISPTLPGGSFTSTNVGFASVKLPGSFVQEAKQAALAMRRSTAGQIEYWALLGKAVEDGGLTVKEAAQALSTPAGNSQAEPDAWLADYVQFDAGGGLARHVRQAIAHNAAQAPNPLLAA